MQISQPDPAFVLCCVVLLRPPRGPGPYQAGVAVVVSQLPGDVPVCVLLDGGHVRELDGAAEVIKLQLQTGRFLCVCGVCGVCVWCVYKATERNENNKVSPGANC